ncbi:MAG: hypothetical protein K5872_13405 [Rhizobiaceae bacterium]|nr:hypothetical protein [Rhizobiaceae bacterium]MCV0407217.1 hypothetical protein [Rhizobiaceae bacterium]
MPKIRDHAYYMSRLEREHPTIFADWKAGKYRSARQALIAAGLRREQTHINTLKAAWKKASRREQTEFLKWVGTSTSTSAAPIVDAERRLLTTTAARIATVMARRGIEMGGVMDEMGFKRRDASLGNAMANRPTRLRPDVVRALEAWLDTNRTV